jgi:peptide/nickel transport system substrate-binding protein
MHAEGDHHVRIEFSERPQLGVWPHGVGLAPIMAEHVWRDHGAASAADLFDKSGSGDVGGGPLVIATVSESTVISRGNDGYPLATPPEIIEYRVFADEDEAVAALRRGEIDSVMTPKGLTDQHVAQIDSDPGVSVIDNPANGVRYLGFNLDRYPMADQQFRTALALLVERGALADAISPGGAPAWSLVPEANARWFDPSAAADNRGLFEGTLAVRLDTAIEGLSAAGYEWEKAPVVGSDGKLVPGSGLTIDGLTPQPLTILTPGDAYDPARPRYVEKIAETLNALGFDARPVETDFDTVVDLAFTPGEDGALHYDMYLLGWTLGNPALPGYYGALFATDGPMNNTGYASTEFAEALDSYESAYTPDDAFDALWEMERTLAVDLPYLLLYRDQITEAYRSDRVSFDLDQSLGGLQARLGGIRDVQPNR